ncbi:MAG: hypothetical protein AB1486_03530 [Planctomycetota bacterium]
MRELVREPGVERGTQAGEPNFRGYRRLSPTLRWKAEPHELVPEAMLRLLR